ncbi:MAG: hypothetical protein AAF915_21025 [Cyanobacteria bacterium P01_D01_bin.50]
MAKNLKNFSYGLLATTLNEQLFAISRGAYRIFFVDRHLVRDAQA